MPPLIGSQLPLQHEREFAPQANVHLGAELLGARGWTTGVEAQGHRDREVGVRPAGGTHGSWLDWKGWLAKHTSLGPYGPYGPSIKEVVNDSQSL